MNMTSASFFPPKFWASSMSSWHLSSWAGRSRTQVSVFLSEIVLDWNVSQRWVRVGLVACPLLGQTGQCWDNQLLPNALGGAHYFWDNLRAPRISFPVHFFLLTSFVFCCTENNTKERHSNIPHNNFHFSVSMGS